MDTAAYISADSSRTAGQQAQPYKSIQAWKTKKTPVAQNQIEQTAKISAPQKQILANLEKASHGQVGTFDMALETSFSYADSGAKINDHDSDKQTEPDQSYQFGDVVDVVNPLHHLPIVGMVYRELTGDNLHPMSQVIGGALYGGPIGAVAGTVNAIAQVQTGKDLNDHALSFVGFDTDNNNTVDKNSPEELLNDVADTLDRNESLKQLPGSALSFVNLSETGKQYEKIKIADGRTAGSMIVKKDFVGYRQQIQTDFTAEEVKQIPQIDIEKLPVREEITSLTLSTMPPRQDV